MANDDINLWEIPEAKEIYMIVGWRQWADAGAISSALPRYLIDTLQARKIGEMKPGNYYLFQVPGTHHLLRPVIKLEDGYRRAMETPQNEFYYAGDAQKGVVIFLGEEPHFNVDLYAEGLLTAVSQLNAVRVAAVGGVYGSLPYDKDRDISCIYSLPHMKKELESYAVRFSDYEGGATIGSYVMHKAEEKNIAFVEFYAFVPAYDFSESLLPQGMRIEQDYKAWYDVMRRINHMFGLKLNLAPLEKESQRLLQQIDEKVVELDQKYPQLKMRAYLDALSQEYQERPFDPLDTVWEEEIADLFRDMEE